MRKGQVGINGFMNEMVNKILKKTQSPTFATDVNPVNMLQQITANNMVPVMLYNSLSWNVTHYIKIRCNRTDLVIYDSNGNLVLSQINPVFIPSNEDTDDVIIPPAKYNLFFIAKDLLPLSFTTYFIKKSTNSIKEPVNLGQILTDFDGYKIGEKGFYSIEIDNKSNVLTSITNNVLNKTLGVTNKFKQYGSMGFLSGWDDNLQQEDPYIMRPAQDNRWKFNSNTGFAQHNLRFRQFGPVPANANLGIITQPFISAYDTNNRFMTHVCDINLKVSNFTLQYFNIYGNHWSNSDYFGDWMVFGDEYNSYEKQSYFDNKYYGSAAISSPKNGISFVYTLDLSSFNFASTPMIFTSIRKANCNDIKAYYSAVITNLTKSNAKITISRVDDMSSTSWPTDIYLDWIAFDPTQMNNNDISIVGSIDLDATNTHFHKNISFTDTDPQFVVFEPVILIQVQQVSPSGSNTVYWSTNAVNNNKDGFILSMQSFTENNKTPNAKLKIFYWAFERIVMKDDVSTDIKNTIITGPLIDEIHQFIEQNYSQSFRVINNNIKDQDLNYIENDIFLGYIHDYTSVVSHFNLDDTDKFDRNYTIYTNQNALQYITRKYNAFCDERVACNFWPTSSQSYIENINDNLRFSTIMSQSHGVGSYNKNEYELLLHRRCACDDYPFENRCLFPTTNVHETVRILYDNEENSSFLNRRLQLLQQYQPLQFFSIVDSTNINDYKSKFNVEWTAINPSYVVPDNIQILDLRFGYLNNSKMILQLWNMFEINENKKYSVNVSVDLKSIFDKNVISITNVTEMQLTAMLPIEKVKRLKWKYKTQDGNVEILDKDQVITEKRRRDKSPTNIVMSPRDIRTFVVNINSS